VTYSHGKWCSEERSSLSWVHIKFSITVKGRLGKRPITDHDYCKLLALPRQCGIISPELRSLHAVMWLFLRNRSSVQITCLAVGRFSFFSKQLTKYMKGKSNRLQKSQEQEKSTATKSLIIHNCVLLYITELRKINWKTGRNRDADFSVKSREIMQHLVPAVEHKIPRESTSLHDNAATI